MFWQDEFQSNARATLARSVFVIETDVNTALGSSYHIFDLESPLSALCLPMSLKVATLTSANGVIMWSMMYLGITTI